MAQFNRDIVQPGNLGVWSDISQVGSGSGSGLSSWPATHEPPAWNAMSASTFLSAGHPNSGISSSYMIGGIESSRLPSLPPLSMPRSLPPPPPPPFDAPPRPSAEARTKRRSATRAKKNAATHPPASEWDKHKATIRSLYIDQGLSLQLTKNAMESSYGFIASVMERERMYKAKFAEWKLTKAIRYPLAKKIAEEAEHRGDKPTVVIFNDNKTCPVPLSRVLESLHRYEAQPDGNHARDVRSQARLPAFVLCTPENTTSPAGQVQSPAAGRQIPQSPAVFIAATAAAVAHESCAGQQVWTPSNVADHLAPSQESSTLRTDWHGMSLAQLHQLKWDAARLDAEGRTEEAEGLFATAVSGFKHLLSGTHDLTAKATYQLAAFYANHERMADADKALHWLSESHIVKWGVEHERTLAHYLRVVLLLYSWGREEHAEVLVYRITEALQNDSCDLDSAPRIPSNDHAHVMDTIDEDSVAQMFAETMDERRIDTQLRIADLCITTGLASMQQILPQLISHCDRRPDRLAVQALQARCRLSRFYITRGNDGEASEALLDARRALSRFVSNGPEGGTTILQTVLPVARELAFLHLDNKDRANCDKVLSWVSEKLERRAGTGDVSQESTDMVTIGFLTQTALEYQRRSGWNGARPWIEWAYGISSRVLGPRHSKTQVLEAALRNERYELLGGDLAMNLLTPGLRDITLDIV